MLYEFVGSENKEKVLKFLLNNENQSFNLIEVSKQTGVSKSQIKGILDKLNQERIVSKVNKRYQIEKNYVTKYLKKLLLPDEIFKDIIDYLKKILKDKKVSIFLIGSKSRLQDKEKSDVDFLLVCKEEDVNTITDIATDAGLYLTDYLTKYVEILTLTKSQFEEIKSRNDPFYVNALTDHVTIKDDLVVFK